MTNERRTQDHGTREKRAVDKSIHLARLTNLGKWSLERTKPLMGLNSKKKKKKKTGSFVILRAARCLNDLLARSTTIVALVAKQSNGQLYTNKNVTMLLFSFKLQIVLRINDIDLQPAQHDGKHLSLDVSCRRNDGRIRIHNSIYIKINIMPIILVCLYMIY